VTIKNPRFSSFERLQQAAANQPALGEGESGEHVAAIQQALIDLGMKMPRSTNNSTTLPDGIFGIETAARVKEFQALNGLMSDGIVGKQTITKLEALIEAAHNKSEAALRLDVMRFTMAG
jgi:peptidoglycan hydrolase-like protein with peptidoglycan-binding domain